MDTNIIFLLIILQILCRFGNARPVTVQHSPTSAQIEKSNSTSKVLTERSKSENNGPIKRSNSTNNFRIERSNTTKNGSMDATPLSRTIHYSLKHIPREKRESPEKTVDFHGLHQPCDLDTRVENRLKMPILCKYAFHARYETLELYRKWRLYQMEAFTFNQHYERFRRFETEQHVFEYRSTGLLS